MIKKTIFGVCFIAILTSTALADELISLKVELQTSMQRHIDRRLIDSAYVDVDLESGSLKKYFPTKAHQIILKGNGYYVLCVDMHNSDGKSTDVDFYITRTPRGLKVIRTEIGNRGPIKSLMRSGKVKRL